MFEHVTFHLLQDDYIVICLSMSDIVYIYAIMALQICYYKYVSTIVLWI